MHLGTLINSLGFSVKWSEYQRVKVKCIPIDLVCKAAVSEMKFLRFWNFVCESVVSCHKGSGSVVHLKFWALQWSSESLFVQKVSFRNAKFEAPIWGTFCDKVKFWAPTLHLLCQKFELSFGKVQVPRPTCFFDQRCHRRSLLYIVFLSVDQSHSRYSKRTVLGLITVGDFTAVSVYRVLAIL